MTLQGIGVIFFGGCFMLANALVLFLTGVWVRFSPYEAQILSGMGNFLIPVGTADVPLFTLNALIYRSIPFAVVVLLIVSSACLFAHVRLSK